MTHINIRNFGGATDWGRTQLNNRYGKNGWYYCGRTVGVFHASPLANPFHIGKDGTREEAIEKYKIWITEKMLSGDENILQALENARGKVLVCWCYPEACHASCIEEILGE